MRLPAVDSAVGEFARRDLSAEELYCTAGEGEEGSRGEDWPTGGQAEAAGAEAWCWEEGVSTSGGNSA